MTNTTISSESVSLKLNSNNFLSNLGAIFTSSKRILQEMIQNANRANATQINFEFNESENSLTISDDGIGIDDMQKLFTIAESGWDTSVQYQHPYGMGFIGVLFNCAEIVISSKGKRLIAQTNDILSSKPIEVQETINTPSKTIIVLNGLNKNFAMYLKEMDIARTSLANGYDLPVYINHTKLTNHNSINILESNDTYISHVFEYGTIYANFDNNRYYSAFLSQSAIQNTMSYKPTLYLQGAEIDIEEASSSKKTNAKANNIIIHFNNKVRARMPDRAQCLDAQIIVEAINAETYKLKRKIIEKNISLKGVNWFYESESNWLMGVAVTPELISKLDELTGKALYKGKEFNFSHSDYVNQDFERSDITKSKILNNEYFLFDEPELEKEESNISEVYAANLEKAVFVSTSTNYYKGTEWAEILKSKVIPLPDEEKIRIKPINSNGRFSFNGININTKVELCEEIRLKGEFGEVSITDTPIYDGYTVYITEDMNCDDILFSISSCNDEFGDFNKSAFDEDCDNFQRLKTLMKCNNSAQMLTEIISKNSNLDYFKELLKGGSLNVTCDAKGNLIVSES